LLHIDVLPPCGQDVAKIQRTLNLTSLSRAVIANLLTLDGIQASPDQPLSCRILNLEAFRAPCEGESAKQALAQRRMGKNSLAPPAPAKSSGPGLCPMLQVSGADGPSAAVVNGRYVLQKGETLNGRELYRKDGKELDVWIAFVKGRWYVTDTTHKEKNNGGGWLYSEAYGEHTPLASNISRWEEWDGKAWSVKPEAKVECVRMKTWTLRSTNAGCKNWRSILLGENTLTSNSGECGRRCTANADCVGFNFFDQACSVTHDAKPKGVSNGTCSLFRGRCEIEPSECWMEYAIDE